MSLRVSPIDDIMHTNAACITPIYASNNTHFILKKHAARFYIDTSSMIKCALLLLLWISMHDAFNLHMKGDVWCDIAQKTHQLHLHKQATRGVIMRKKQLLSGASNVSTKENAWLNEVFGKLSDKEDKIHAELQELIVTALMQQVNEER